MQTLVSKFVEPSRILLVILLAVVIAQTGWFFASGPAPLSLQVQNQTVSNNPQSSVSAQNIAVLNLFGANTAAASAPVQNNFNATQTRLRLELQAVFQAEHAEDSAAIIAEAKRAGLLYQVGKKLPGNAILKEVYADRVVLKRGEIYETLRFPKVKTLISESRSSNQPVQNSQSGSILQSGSLAANRTNQTMSSPVQSSRSTSNLSSQLKQFQTNLQNDPKTTLAQIGVNAVSSGKSEGYRLGDLANSTYLKQTGLQANDVVLSVNNQPIGNIQQDQLRIASILAQGSARLEVQRGERTFFVTASLK